MEKRLTVLLCNDDGYDAEGIRNLFPILSKEFNLIVVAPENEQSGVSHSFTSRNGLTYRSRSSGSTYRGYSVSGTPADCIKFGLSYLCIQKPDIVVSGINNGDNAGIAQFYSGTIAAAREATFYAIPSIAFSLSSSGFNHIVSYAPIVRVIIQKLLNGNHFNPAHQRVFYNVNFPACPLLSCKGIKVTRQSCAYYHDTYVNKTEGTDSEFWLDGTLVDVEPSIEFDTQALRQHYITITPLRIDVSAHLSVFESIRGLESMSLKDEL